MKASHIALALLFLNGLLSAAAYVASAKASEADEKLRKAEAQARTYAGKFLDLQERAEEDKGELNSSITMLQWQLSQCRGGK